MSMDHWYGTHTGVIMSVSHSKLTENSVVTILTEERSKRVLYQVASTHRGHKSCSMNVNKQLG